MQRLILIFFIASELCFYLLIAQTGIVEYFSSKFGYKEVVLFDDDRTSKKICK